MNELYKKAQERHRATDEAMEDMAGMEGYLLKANAKKMSPHAAMALNGLLKQAPEPLTAVDDLRADEDTQWRTDLLKDAATYTNRRQAAEKALVAMEEKHEQAATELNALRLHMNGQKPQPRYKHLNTWAQAHPVETKWLKQAKANGRAARERKGQAIAQLQVVIDGLPERLARYEAEFGPLEEVQKTLNSHASIMQQLKRQQQATCEKQAKLQEEAPLLWAPEGQNLSLAVQFPKEADAAQLVEEKMARAKAERKKQDCALRKEGKRKEEKVRNTMMQQALGQLQEGQAVDLPEVDPEALNPMVQAAIPAMPVVAPSPTGQQPLTQVPQATQAPAPLAPSGSEQATSQAAPTQHVQPVQSAQPAPDSALASTPEAALDINALRATFKYSHPSTDKFPTDVDPKQMHPAYRPKGWTHKDEAQFQEFIATNGGREPKASPA